MRKTHFLFMGLFAGLCLGGLALAAPWADSELWSLGISRFFPFGGDPASFYKPLFHLWLRLGYVFDFGDAATVDFARLSFALLAFASLWLFYLLARKLSGRPAAALWCCLLLVTSPLFLSQSYQIRSDVMALFFQLLIFLHLLRRARAPEGSSWTGAGTGLALNLLLLLSTPKAVFHLAVALVFGLCLSRDEGRLRRDRWFFVKSFGLPLLPLTALALWKRIEFEGAVLFFLASYLETPSHPGFFSVASSWHVGVFLLQHWFLFFLALSSWVFLGRSRSPLDRTLAFTALASLLPILLHSDRLPFFIYSMMPPLVLFAGLSSFRAFSRFSPERRRSLATVLALLLIWLVVRVFTTGYRITVASGSGPQRVAQRVMGSYLDAFPDAVYYDATFVLPRRNQLHALPAPAHPGNLEEVLNVLDRPELKIVFFGSKMFHYFQEIGHKLEERPFIRIGNIVLAEASLHLATQVLTLADWDALCRRFGEPKDLYVYEGNGIFMMEPLGGPRRCDEAPPAIRSRKQFLAYTPFPPLAWPGRKAFAELFDRGWMP